MKYWTLCGQQLRCVTILSFVLLGNPLRINEVTIAQNVVLVITDDQGYGDLGIHGNALIRTPNLDRLAEESLVHTHFYVSPVCAPTRASLMTGRYNYRTGVVDTWLGRAMMYPEEVTLAELLSGAGYVTGIFGKWHLGDNHPMRPMDQGFRVSLVHRGGGIGQPADPPGNTYFNPLLLRNGREVREKGYCTDIFFDAALEFVERHRKDHFFAYIATNAPHTPLQIAEEYVAPYRAKGLDETSARVYGMITNIDENIGRLLTKLEALNLRNNTILIFMSDNGHQQPRYSAGLRGRKTSVFEGGIRVPFFVHWPSEIRPGKTDLVSAHLDVVPTILDACGVKKPPQVHLDGISLLSFWKGEETSRPDRLLFFQAHRGDVPQPGRACAVRSSRYKLLQPEGWSSGPGPDHPKWMLFDLFEDPGEQRDISSKRPELVEAMRSAYQAWFRDVSATRGYQPPPIALGTKFENPVILTRQDWRGSNAGWGATGRGYWFVEVRKTSRYKVRFRFPAAESEGFAELTLNGLQAIAPVAAGAEAVDFEPLTLSKGEARLEATLHLGNQKFGAHYVDISLLNGPTQKRGQLLLHENP